MGRIEGGEQEERLLFMPFDEVNTFIPLVICYVGNRLSCFIVTFYGRHVPFSFWFRLEIVVAATGISPEFVKPPFRGMELRIISQVPFADEPCYIPQFFQSICNGCFRQWQPKIFRIKTRQRAYGQVIVMAKVYLVPTRQESRTRGTAYRCGNISLREVDSFKRKPVNIGCIDLLAAREAEIGIPQIIGNNKYEVWLLLGMDI